MQICVKIHLRKKPLFLFSLSMNLLLKYFNRQKVQVTSLISLSLFYSHHLLEPSNTVMLSTEFISSKQLITVNIRRSEN